MRVGEPMERMAIDLTGPHPTSRAGHVYIMTVMDHFSKWAEAVPLRNKEATTVAKALLNQVLSRVGLPLQLLSDQGKEFEAKVFSELCQGLGIDKVRTSGYKPSTNGQIERFHRTLNSMLGKVVEENQRDWDERLPAVMAAYRASVHEATGYTPNFLMFMREHRAPLDVAFGRPEEEEGTSDYHEYVEQQLERMRNCYELVREHTGQAVRRMKTRYDLRARPSKYEVGQWVWVYSPRRFLRRSPKWQKMYSGPYLIVRKVGGVNFVVQRTKRSNPLVVHMDKLKRVRGETPESWLGETEVDTTLPAVVERFVAEPALAEEEAEEGQEVREEWEDQEEAQVGAEVESSSGRGDVESAVEQMESGVKVGQRQRRAPRRLFDYVC